MRGELLGRTCCSLLFLLLLGISGRSELLCQLDQPEQPADVNGRRGWKFCLYRCIVVGLWRSGYRALQEMGVRSFDATPGRGAMPASREDSGGLGQPLDAYRCGFLRKLFGGGCLETGLKDRVLLHAGARMVAEHG